MEKTVATNKDGERTRGTKEILEATTYLTVHDTREVNGRDAGGAAYSYLKTSIVPLTVRTDAEIEVSFETTGNPYKTLRALHGVFGIKHTSITVELHSVDGHRTASSGNYGSSVAGKIAEDVTNAAEVRELTVE